MKRFDSNPFRRFDALLGAILLGIAAVGTTACSGDDGSTGPQGPSGPPGDGGTTSTEVEPGDDAPGIHVAILSVDGGSGAGGAFQVGDHAPFTFSVTKDDGSDWDLSESNDGRAMLSGPTFNYQRVSPEVTNVAATAVDNLDGTFTYTFASAIPATYAAPLNDTASFGAADGELTGQASPARTRSASTSAGTTRSRATPTATRATPCRTSSSAARPRSTRARSSSRKTATSATRACARTAPGAT